MLLYQAFLCTCVVHVYVYNYASEPHYILKHQVYLPISGIGVVRNATLSNTFKFKRQQSISQRKISILLI